jgi:hypothetical protein
LFAQQWQQLSHEKQLLKQPPAQQSSSVMGLDGFVGFGGRDKLTFAYRNRKRNSEE